MSDLIKVPLPGLRADLIEAMRFIHAHWKTPEEFCLGNRLRMASEKIDDTSRPTLTPELSNTPEA